MSFSLYYSAERNNPLTKKEKSAIEEIAEKYSSKYPYNTKTENFGIYSYNKEENIIFSGSTKLPDLNVEFLYQVAEYWLKFLTEITALLSDCKWTVSFDDIDLIFDNNGWRFPTDEEYKRSDF